MFGSCTVEWVLFCLVECYPFGWVLLPGFLLHMWVSVCLLWYMNAEDWFAHIFIVISKSCVCKNKYTEPCLCMHTNAVEALQNNEITSPALSSSSSELPAQGVCALKAPSMFSRNSWTDALSFSGSGALFEKVNIKL